MVEITNSKNVKGIDPACIPMTCKVPKTVSQVLKVTIAEILED